MGCKISLKMLQVSFFPNELTPGLEEVGLGLVLVCTTRVHPFCKGENCVFSWLPKFVNFIMCKISFVQKWEGLHSLALWVAVCRVGKGFRFLTLWLAMFSEEWKNGFYETWWVQKNEVPKMATCRIAMFNEEWKNGF